MAEKSIPSGMIMPYGVAIGNALRKPDTSVDELVALRDHAQSIVSAQGDLVAALKSLDDAIAAGAGKPAAAPASERFVAQIDGLALSDAVKSEIEQAIQKAVSAEVAKIDTAGDLVATPLSTIRDFGFGPGSRTRGYYMVSKNLGTR
jgi:crotonobetainyl-CoA:carnitine CoA-transferase CaiB-like acyl-CoA transferase